MTRPTLSSNQDAALSPQGNQKMKATVTLLLFYGMNMPYGQLSDRRWGKWGTVLCLDSFFGSILQKVIQSVHSSMGLVMILGQQNFFCACIQIKQQQQRKQSATGRSRNLLMQFASLTYLVTESIVHQLIDKEVLHVTFICCVSMR